MQPALVLIDGECGLCRRAGHYGMRHASPGMLRFVANDDEDSRSLLRDHGLLEEASRTIVVIEEGRAHVRSDAIVQIAKRLRWPHRAQAALWIVPAPLRDLAYDWVAKRRRRLMAAPPPDAR
jgi:predicted DCC family thiol-disulfide oxidoreductase YuxK